MTLDDFLRWMSEQPTQFTVDQDGSSIRLTLDIQQPDGLLRESARIPAYNAVPSSLAYCLTNMVQAIKDRLNRRRAVAATILSGVNDAEGQQGSQSAEARRERADPASSEVAPNNPERYPDERDPDDDLRW